METKTHELTKDLELALTLADLADEITMSYFGNPDLTISQKADLTPVSEADRLVEKTLREYLAIHRPEDGILGEEYGTESSANKRQWIIDPIDGTKNYIRGIPIWATLIGLAIADEIPVGVVSAPALGRRWYAAKNQGAYLINRLGNCRRLSLSKPRPPAEPTSSRITVSKIDEIKDASISYASLTGWEKLGLHQEFLNLIEDCTRQRAYGDFWSYMLVAEGAVDIAAEPELEIYDMAALVPIVTEAGGIFTDLKGNPGPWGGNAVAANPHLHQQVLARLK